VKHDVSRLARELGLSFGNEERLRAHVAWELDRGR
jgi:hypothetical protein